MVSFVPVGTIPWRTEPHDFERVHAQLELVEGLRSERAYICGVRASERVNDFVRLMHGEQSEDVVHDPRRSFLCKLYAQRAVDSLWALRASTQVPSRCLAGEEVARRLRGVRL